MMPTDHFVPFGSDFIDVDPLQIERTEYFLFVNLFVFKIYFLLKYQFTILFYGVEHYIKTSTSILRFLLL